MYFFQVGKKYKVITARVDTKHSKHFFESGKVVTCTEVEPVDGYHSLTRGCLAGTFSLDEDPTWGQTLYTGDVVKL